MLWPLDGDPNRMMGMLAHPGEIAGMSVSFDGRRLITAGPDGIVNQWNLHTEVLERAGDLNEKADCKWERILGDADVLDDIKRCTSSASFLAKISVRSPRNKK